MNDLLAKGQIRKSNSPYASPVILIDKKNGSKRLVSDFRDVNKNTVSDKEPIPRMDTIADRFHGAKVFSKFNIAWGYHHIGMNPSDIEKTAFIIPHGHYEWLVMLEGTIIAPSTFQQAMREVLKGLINRLVQKFLDDTGVYSVASKSIFNIWSKYLHVSDSITLSSAVRNANLANQRFLSWVTSSATTLSDLIPNLLKQFWNIPNL